ncbi:NrtA/SsuA/CpmA family ABC transporter substrate-binding protein [Bradyrhizobium elkanii]|uniref:NrtA/SsuA/CpmA family ABC transporter substrate-binding protein n=1 Tax=Bradyrhizobium elkanii TaxID=29448 RepID=UPI00209FFFB4|nr:NrtA/SsuA/CpmA family ABC transporter substrate-binding protein [Bradyrhizobium elkanii]MCP1967048.1 sulfonate transport system substrate-binding protein [Bradyrhizobium elkanii]MCS3523217.1 sulfonate transport system substrate-binding protein [Bradyrhizobium elkanii]MCS4070872.1 sulfonate transport system substrate-binding protein [Bradyrhizobium elkanii]MCS4077503.1 sulfonate transport system substrate-binding protein [Bradyrhizobium elkanii]MCS4111446.1 sulfonate transport system substra
MSIPRFTNPTRRSFLGGAAFGIGALAGFDLSEPAHAATGRVTDTVRLTWGLSGLNLIAKERGEFEKLLARDGIKVEWLGPFPNHAPTLQAVTGGSADFSFGGSTTPALAAIIAGSPLVFTQFVVYEPRTTAIIARDDSGINKVEDLVGKSVAVNRSGLGEFLLVAALEKHKVDRSKVTFVYLNPPDAAPALASAKVDAWSMWSPGVDIARLEYKAHDIFLEGRDLEFQIDYTSYLTTRKFATDNPALVRAVNDAFRAEGKWISANSKDAEYIAQKAGKYSDQVRDQFIALNRQYRYFAANDENFLAELQRAADWLVARKVLPEPIKVTDHLAQV